VVAAGGRQAAVVVEAEEAVGKPRSLQITLSPFLALEAASINYRSNNAGFMPCDRGHSGKT
jgi:hypothetical protein